MITDAGQVIGQSLGELFACSPAKEHTRIRTPFLYPDGDVIDLFLTERGGVLTVTDLGETLGWLRMQSPSARRSPKQQKLIEDVCLNHGLELYKGRLLARVPEGGAGAGVHGDARRPGSVARCRFVVHPASSRRRVGFGRSRRVSWRMVLR